MTGLPLPAMIAVLLLWGTLVGLDLVSVPQGLLSRPLVAATVAGWMVGDIDAGLRVGALLELFALDVLPVGASRYPEYGPAAVGAAVAAAGLPAAGRIGAGVLLGLLLALVAGWTLDWLRHANARHVHRMTPELVAGSPEAIRRLQWTGLARDVLRSLGMTALALGAASLSWGLHRAPPVYLTQVLVGVGLAAALSGAFRTAGRGRRLGWLGVGVATGVLVVVVFGVAS